MGLDQLRSVWSLNIGARGLLHWWAFAAETSALIPAFAAFCTSAASSLTSQQRDPQTSHDTVDQEISALNPIAMRAAAKTEAVRRLRSEGNPGGATQSGGAAPSGGVSYGGGSGAAPAGSMSPGGFGGGIPSGGMGFGDGMPSGGFDGISTGGFGGGIRTGGMGFGSGIPAAPCKTSGGASASFGFGSFPAAPANIPAKGAGGYSGDFPAMPSTPVMPSMPSMPSIPNMPSAPSVPASTPAKGDATATTNSPPVFSADSSSTITTTDADTTDLTTAPADSAPASATASSGNNAAQNEDGY